MSIISGGPAPNVRLALFDIDGTLLAGSPARHVFCRALDEVYSTDVSLEQVNFSGKTDPQIAHELLAAAGVERERAAALLPRMLDRYLELLEGALADAPPRELPGARSLLDRLAKDAVGVALLTGNVARGARLKLGSVGLDRYFTFGAFGSDSMDRNELPAIALERARSGSKLDLAPADAVIIGDTPRDVLCGQLAGMDTLAVATGNYSLDELSRTGADWVVPDLEAPGVFERIAAGGSGERRERHSARFRLAGAR